MFPEGSTAFTTLEYLSPNGAWPVKVNDLGLSFDPVPSGFELFTPGIGIILKSLICPLLSVDVILKSTSSRA